MLVNDTTMVMKIRPDHFMEHIESNDFKVANPLIPGRKDGLKYFADSLKKAGFDNPVLMFVTFEDNSSKEQQENEP
jgi:hypothetical protein